MKPVVGLLLVGVWAMLGFASPPPAGSGSPVGSKSPEARALPALQPVLDTAYFAGGCFWCMEPPFDVVDGVLSTTSGFMGGSVRNPTYDQVVMGRTGHAEIVRVIFEPRRVSYEALLQIFWVNVDPLDPGGQFCDRGDMYRSEIFAKGLAQLVAARASLASLERSGRFASPIATRVSEAGDFYEAEAYHQDYYLKNPVRYRFYRTNCGRDQRLNELWGRSGG
jgi:peptide-methionine (S)-S-oxide reductase